MFEFAAHHEFRNRRHDLERLEAWWTGEERNALALYGRRRVGKSWLVRELAHGKRALVLVVDRMSLEPQMARLADEIAPALGVRPAIHGLDELFEVLYRLAATEKWLVAIDEFQYLLPDRARVREEVLTSIQRVMERREESRLKLILSGSFIGQMEKLLTGPLRGRLTPLRVDPLELPEARAFLPAGTKSESAIERYAVAGGNCLYLEILGGTASLRRSVIEKVLSPFAPLHSDPREVLEEELRSPGTYFSIIESLSRGAAGVAEIAAAVGRRSTELQPYLESLEEMRLVRRAMPVTGGRRSRGARFELADDFMRFWFRFVFRFRAELEAGLDPARLYDEVVAPELASHVAPTFERLARDWVRRERPDAIRVGSWWGNSLNALRRQGERSTEEIDVVATAGNGVVNVVGECKWSRRLMKPEVLDDLERYKLPAMRQAGVRLSAGGPAIYLFSRSGFSKDLRVRAEERPDISLVDLAGF